MPKLQQVQRINATEKYLICKGSIFALLRSFVRYSNFSLLIRLFNATHAKITYLCNRFGHWERLINKYLQTYIMCGVRCTPNLAAYCNNGLHLTFRGEGVIFKLLHKLILKCCITYFNVLYHLF